MDINKFLEIKLNSEELRISFAGEFSSGKSTLINALLHKDLLKHSTYETTVVPVQIANVRKNDEKCRTIEIFYNDGSSQSGSFKDLIALTTTSGEHSTVSQIENVTVYIHFMDTDVPLMFLDTPGLNSIADFHRESSVRSVISAHLCVYALPRPRLSLVDIEFLDEITKYQPNFVFSVGFMDTMGDGIEKSNRQMQSLTRQIKKRFPNINFNIVQVSALLALAGRDRGIKRLYACDEFDIQHDERAKFVKESNIAELEAYIKDFVNRATEIKFEASRQAMTTVLRLKTEEAEAAAVADLSDEELEKLGVDDRRIAETEKAMTREYAVKTREQLMNALREASNPDLKSANELYEKLVLDYRKKVHAEIELAKKDITDYAKSVKKDEQDLIKQKKAEKDYTTNIPYYNLSSFSKATVNENMTEFFADIPDTFSIREMIGDISDFIINNE